MSTVKLFYWNGRGTVGSVVRHATASQWDHVAVSVELDGLTCYFESYPGTGFRLVPVEGDSLPDATQETGLNWWAGKVAEVMLRLSRRRYSMWNGFLSAVFGIQRKSQAIECAQAASLILQILGLPVPYVGDPQMVATEVEKLTGNPVRLRCS